MLIFCLSFVVKLLILVERGGRDLVRGDLVEASVSAYGVLCPLAI